MALMAKGTYVWVLHGDNPGVPLDWHYGRVHRVPAKGSHTYKVTYRGDGYQKQWRVTMRLENKNTWAEAMDTPDGQAPGFFAAAAPWFAAEARTSARLEPRRRSGRKGAGVLGEVLDPTPSTLAQKKKKRAFVQAKTLMEKRGLRKNLHARA